MQPCGEKALETDHHRQQYRVHRLGEEQVGDAFDVADHPPAFTDNIGQCRELVVQQHNLCHGPSRRTAGAHRDADVGVFERQHIIDAVPSHCHGVTTSLQRVHDGAFLIRSDPPENRVGVQNVGQFPLFGGQFARIDGAAVQSEFGRDRAHRDRVVPGDHLHRNVLAGEILQSPPGVGPNLLFEHDQRLRGDVAETAGMVDAGIN